MRKWRLICALIMICFSFIPIYGQINMLEYFPLRVGDIHTYDDGAQCVIPAMRELDWCEVPAYERFWATNPHSDYSDAAVADYLILRSDSLFWVGHFWLHNNGNWEFHQITSSCCIGTASMSPGEEIVSHVVMENMNAGDTEEFDITVKVESAGTLSVPAGTYEDCIKFTEKVEGDVFTEWYLAKGVGVIKGGDIDVSEDHSLESYQNGETFEINEYFPLDEGCSWTYEDGSCLVVSGTTEFDFYENPVVEMTWTSIPDPEIPDSETKSYYALKGDSLFWVAHYVNKPTWDNPEYFSVSPPLFMGTGSTPLGVSIPTTCKTFDILSGEFEEDWETEVVYVPAGTVVTPAGTFENCIKLINFVNDWTMDILTLAPEVGMIIGRYKEEMELQALTAFEQGEESPEGPVCDFNGDGKKLINDVIAYLMYAKKHPEDLARLDWNGDGKYAINDAIVFLINLTQGTCPDLLVELAGATDELQAKKMEGLTQADIEYIEKMMALMDLTEEQEAAFRLALYGQANASALPKAMTLAQNAPNPFNPATTIGFSVPQATSVQVSLEVYDLRGRLVRVLVDEMRQAGTYTVFWDGTDQSGAGVSSGVYLYRMKAGDFVQTRKMVLLK